MIASYKVGVWELFVRFVSNIIALELQNKSTRKRIDLQSFPQVWRTFPFSFNLLQVVPILVSFMSLGKEISLLVNKGP